MRGNTITMNLAKGSIARAGGLFQYDYGQRLILNGVELPVAYEVHFSNKERGESKTCIGDSTGVDIPDEYLQTGENIHVWLYLHEGEDDGETEYHGIIAVQKRAKPLNVAPTPVQQDVITQTIAALDDAVEEVEGIAEEIPNTIDTALQEAKDSGEFDGFSPTANVVKDGHVATITITDKDGTTTATVEDGSAVMIDDNAGAGVKDKTWSADKITAAIGDINSFDIEIVQTLPQTGDEHTIYFVPKAGGHGDSYDEYLYLNGQWEMIGTTDVDVSTKADKTDTVLLTTLSRGRRSGTTVGGNSFAFGQDVTASANNTHAEGYNTRATGAGAHAEGGNTTASGQYSHAEGENATASGLRSHAEGYITTASGSYSHAEGYGAVGTGALGKADHAEGYQTTANSGGGASVYAAHAEGKNTIASSNAAHAEGEGAMASGTASHAEGSGTSATAASSHAEGTSTQATGSQSHSEGNSSVASGESAHSEGNSTTASGSYAHAEGNSTTASGIGSHAEGVSVSGKGAFGQADHSEGYHTTANSGTGDKYGAHAEGRLTTASNNAAHAEGWSSTASGSCSHAEGSNTTASGGGSHAEGSVTTASGAGAHSEGDHTVASGQHSHAQGGYTEASGMYSFAAGNGTIANASGSFVFGMHNVPDVLEYPEWVSGTHYYVGNKVRHLNQMAWPNPIWENKECIEENSDTYFTAQKWKSAESPYNYTHLEIVGNGTINNKSNARSLDKYGTERLKGDLYVNCNADSSGGHKVIAEPATEGTSGQVLTTDGQGGRSWTTVQGGGNIIDDTAGVGDTDKTYSADKLATDHSSLLNAINGLPETKLTDEADADLDLTDASGNVIVRLKDGHIQTKNFDSEMIGDGIAKSTNARETDIDFADNEGNVILRLSNGHIKTKNFDSTDLVDPYAVPDYYHTNGYLKGKCDKLNQFARACAKKLDTFAFFTDLHWHLNAKKSPAILRYIKENTRIDKFFCGGDVMDFIKTEHDPYDAFTEFYEALNLPIYTAMGNHEYLVAQYGKEGRLYYTFNSVGRDRFGNFDRNYFYLDNPQPQIRYIFLNAFAEGNSSWSYGYEQAQLDWLANTALDLEAGWGAVIVTHMTHSIDFSDGSVPKDSHALGMLSVLDSYSGDGEIIAVISGHTHADYLDTTTGGIPIIVTTCDKYEPWISSGTNMEPWLSDRVEGTITEQVIDLFVIDRDAKEIKKVRVGCPIHYGTDPTTWTDYEDVTISYDRT